MTSAIRNALRVRVEGRVQGVGFRIWVRGEAEGLGLDGWVRNEADGSVAALIAGPEHAVTEMVRRLRQGPSGATVRLVETESADPADIPAGFAIRS